MYQISTEEFQKILDSYVHEMMSKEKRLNNVAVVLENFPSLEKRRELKLAQNQTLLGLYEGIPMSSRQGQSKLLPDKITIYQQPIENLSNNLDDIKKQIRHTLWHELAHHFGLNHDDIKKRDIK